MRASDTERLSPRADGVADAFEIRPHPPASHVGLALPSAADIDARIGFDRQPMAQFAECLVRKLRLEEHAMESVVSGPLSVAVCIHRTTILTTDYGQRTTDPTSIWRICVQESLFDQIPRPALRASSWASCQAAFHGTAVAVVEPGLGETSPHQFFVEHDIAIPHERQKAVVAIFAFQAERKSHAIVRAMDEVFRELARLGAPSFDGRIRLYGFGRVDALQTDACAGSQQKRVAIDDALDFVDPFFELFRSDRQPRGVVDTPRNKQQANNPDDRAAMVIPVAARQRFHGTA